MKSFEVFRAEVYEKANVKQRKIKERNRRLLSVALCVMMAGAVITGAGTINRSRYLIVNESPQYESHTEAALNKGSEEISPKMLVLVNSEGKERAMVLKNREEQKEFAKQYSASKRPGKASPALQAEDTPAKTIHSKDELSAYLEQLPQLAEEPLVDIVGSDYDEAFFNANNLCAVPLDLTGEDQFIETTELPSQIPTEEPSVQVPTTIPDGTNYDSSSTTIMAVETTINPNATTMPTMPPPPSSVASERPKGSVKILILVPMNK